MSLLDQLAEANIEAAMERGELDDLAGAGQPLPPDEAARVPAHLRAGYRLLKNAGYLPPELESQRELNDVEDLLARARPDSREAQRLSRRARRIELRLSQTVRGRALLNDRQYGDRIRQQLNSAESDQSSV